MAFPRPANAIPLVPHLAAGSVPPPPRDDRGFYLPVPDVNVECRWLEAADLSESYLDEMIELLRRAFNGGPSWFHLGVEPVDHLRWKLIDAPGGGIAYMQHALDDPDERPLNVTLMRRQSFVVNGSPLVILQGADAARDPAAQGRGIQTAVTAWRHTTVQAMEEPLLVDWAVVHPIWDHLRDSNPAPGIHELSHRLITYAKPLTWRGLRRRRPSRPEQAGASRTRDQIKGYRRRVSVGLVARMLRAQARGAVHRVRSSKGGRGSGADWRIETVREFGPEADVFWAACEPNFDFAQVRDRAYLNWRFNDRRAGPFEVRVAMAGDQMLGFAAIRADAGEAVLADVLALPERVDVAEALIDDAIALARRAGSPTMRLWLQQRHPYARAIRDRGFFDTDQRLRMYVQRRHSDAPELPFAYDPNARVHATISDSDHV